jgi:hemolysin III
MKVHSHLRTFSPLHLPTFALASARVFASLEFMAGNHLDRPQSRLEEFFNTLSHGLGFFLALLALPYLYIAAANGGDQITRMGAVIFGLSILLLYGASFLYHGTPHSDARAKRRRNVLDHVAIYFLIAGSYTPFLLGVLRGTLGWSVFAAVWALAILGAILKMCGRLTKKTYSVGYYLLMGWFVLLIVVPLAQALTPLSLYFLIGGGVIYTLGVFFYIFHHRPFFHLVWHFFVMAGTGAHVGAVLEMYSFS